MKKLLIAALLIAPSIVSAQTYFGNIEDIMRSIGRLVSLATPLVVGLALLGFFWGLMRFIFAAGNEDAKEEGKRIMIWGIVALFVMLSVWGLIRFIGSALGINDQGQDIGNVPGITDPAFPR